MRRHRFANTRILAGRLPARCLLSDHIGPAVRRRPSIQVISFVRSSVDRVVSTTIASRKWRGLYIGPPLSHRKWRSVGWKARSYSGSSAWYKTNGFALVCSSPCPNRSARWIAAIFSRPRYLVQALGSADCRMPSSTGTDRSSGNSCGAVNGGPGWDTLICSGRQASSLDICCGSSRMPLSSQRRHR